MLHPSSPGSPRYPQGWRETRTVGDSTIDSFTSDLNLYIENKFHGIRLLGTGNTIQKVEVELPTLLYGHNGRIINTQAALDRVLARLKLVLSLFCSPCGKHRGYFPGDVSGDDMTYYTRVDLTWQYNLLKESLFQALRYAKHPEIHKCTGYYEGESVLFPGTNVRITAYDKLKQMHVKQDQNVIRIEVQLKQDKISQHFGLGEGQLMFLDIKEAYQVYRKILKGFNFLPQPCGDKKATVEEILAHLAAKYPDDDIPGIWSTMRKMCDRKARDLRKNVGLRVPALISFSWDNILPADRLPPVVEVQHDVKEQRMAAYFLALPAAPPSPVSQPGSPSFTVTT